MRLQPSLLALWALFAGGALAQDAADLRCAPPDDVLDPPLRLRALSLDVRGALPEPDELEAVEAGAAPEDFLDAWLASPAFAEQAVRRHRALLWNNVENQSLLTASSSLARITTPEFQGAPAVYYRRVRAQGYRGVAAAPCLNEPARFDADGRLLTRTVAGARREGWVEVTPYWDPSQTLRVCGFDANPAQLTPNGAACGTRAGLSDPECGCGPELERCSLGNAHRAVNQAMGEALDRLVHQLIMEDAPYPELFRTRRAFVNGPLSFFYRRQAGVSRFSMDPNPVDPAWLPTLAFTDTNTWIEVELPPSHAGVLTRDAFLLRFQTNRARASRFYEAFLCQPFQPPVGGLPVADVAAASNPDLQERAGCKYCHALLEPAAAYWGRWAESGAAYLDPATFPARREDCLQCARTGRGCTGECRSFYLTNPLSEAEDRFAGMLHAYTFRREGHFQHVETGPRLLALSAVADGRLTQCVARTAAEWLLARDLDHPGDAEWIQALAQGFAAEGYSYRALVRQIVTDARYWRVR